MCAEPIIQDAEHRKLSETSACPANSIRTTVTSGYNTLFIDLPLTRAMKFLPRALPVAFGAVRFAHWLAFRDPAPERASAQDHRGAPMGSRSKLF